MPEFQDRVVVITGAASGLGRACAQRFSSEGALTSLVDRDQSGLTAVAATLADSVSRCLVLSADLGRRDACIEVIARTVERFGGIDVLCNVAGVLGAAHATAVSEDLWNRVMSVNLAAPFWLSQAAIPHLLTRRGNIVNVASVGGLMGAAYVVPYSASKAALIQMTKSLAMEFVRQPIRINAVAPGGINTNIMRNESYPTDADFSLVARYSGIRPAAEPADVADLIVYLASDRARNIHGACLASDGGASA